MLKINEKGNYVFHDPTFKISFEGIGSCSAHFLYKSILQTNYGKNTHNIHFVSLWRTSVYDLIKNTNYKYFHKIEKDFIDNIDDRIRFLIASNKNTSQKSLLILQSDPVELIRSTAKSTLTNNNDPSKLNILDFLDWLERASIEQLESFGEKIIKPMDCDT